MGQVLELPKRRRSRLNAVNGKVAPPRRRPNKDTRSREYLTPSEMDRLLDAAGQAKIGFPVHPHMLRHACAFKLANEGHDIRSLQHYLGHKNIAHTVRYTDLAPDRFKGFWRD